MASDAGADDVLAEICAALDADGEQECCWCGALLRTGRSPMSRSGEIFCSRSHRDASTRALRRLTSRTEAQEVE